MSQDGYDTHSNEPGALTALVDALDRSLDALLVDLAAMNRLGDVVIMTFSEFGRRLAANASLGTDHGVAAPMYLLGGPVRGGLYSTYPSLTDLTLGDLKMTVDFRSVYATVLRDWLNIDPTAILGGSFPTLNLFNPSGSSEPVGAPPPTTAASATVRPTQQPASGPLTSTSEAGPNRLLTTINARSGGTLQSITITRLDNGTVDIGTQLGLGQGVTILVPANSRSVAVAVNRSVAGLATTAHFTVVDSRGAWTTFAGGGPAPWPTGGTVQGAADVARQASATPTRVGSGPDRTPTPTPTPTSGTPTRTTP
jgi:hypothetical protein